MFDNAFQSTILEDPPPFLINVYIETRGPMMALCSADFICKQLKTISAASLDFLRFHQKKKKKFIQNTKLQKSLERDHFRKPVRDPPKICPRQGQV